MSTRRTALVTGGCGFVGRHFVSRLLQDGFDVTVVDDLSTGLRPDRWPQHLRVRAEHVDRAHFHLVDFREYCRHAVADFDLVVHLAAVVGGRLTIEGDPLAVATDLAIDATFFNWIVRSRPLPRRVFNFSSSAAYPIHLQQRATHRPLSEEMISFDERLGVPDLTYGWSKLTAEFLARFAAENYGLNVVSFRPFSGYGEDQDFSYPFPSVIRRVARRDSPIVVWGSGEQLRDFIYIDDVVDASFACAEHVEPGSALNLGSGVGTSFIELSRTACRVLGHDAPVINDPSKPEGVFGRVGDCTRMLRHHTPRVSLEDGIRIVHDYQLRAGLLETGAAV
jgi:UDP-glucose 4-epimerase